MHSLNADVNECSAIRRLAAAPSIQSYIKLKRIHEINLGCEKLHNINGRLGYEANSIRFIPTPKKISF